MEPNYHNTIQRILTILQEDPELSPKIASWRYGEVPENAKVEAVPGIYVTTPSQAEQSRVSAGPASSHTVMPAQKIITEYWIVIIVGVGTTSSRAQAKLYELRNDIIRIISNNTQLRDADGQDRQCDALEFDSIARLVEQRGRTLDGLTVMVRTTNFKNTS